MSVQSRHISTVQKYMWLMATILESAVLRNQMPGHEQQQQKKGTFINCFKSGL